MHAALFKLLEPGHFDGHRVGSRSQFREGELSGGGGREGAHLLIHLVDHLHLGSCDGSSGRIHDTAANRAGGTLSKQGGGG